MANIMCIMEKEGKKCKKCTKGKRGCFWNGILSTTKGKAPQKATASKQSVPIIEIKMTHPQRVTEKAGKSHIFHYYC